MTKVLSYILIIFISSCSPQKDNSEWITKFTKSNQLIEVTGNMMLQDFSLTDSNGKMFNSSTLKGKVILLNFFATWCPPCVAELPEFEKYSKEFDSSKFQFLAMDSKESLSRVSKFMKKHKYSFTAVIDRTGEVLKRYSVISLPSSLVIDKNGRIIYTIRGVRNWGSPDFKKFFNILIGK